MNKEAINEILENKHQKLFDWIKNQPQDSFQKGPVGKSNHWPTYCSFS